MALNYHLHGLRVSGNMDTLIKLTFICFLSSFIFFFVFKKVSSEKAINRRLSVFIPLHPYNTPEEITDLKKGFTQEFISSIARLLKGFSLSKRSGKMLEEAGSKLSPEEFFVLKVLSGIGVAIISMLLGFNWIMGIALAIIGFGIPHFHMVVKRKKRLHLLSYQLIETLGMMANSLRAGFSFMQAMQLVGKELPDPLGPEFERTVREVGLGVPVEEVFESLIQRLPNKELEVVIRAILAQRKSGGNLAELLETMEETIRGRIRILEELKTLTAQGRMSSWVITLLPVALGLYFFTMSPDYFSPMVEHPLGWVMLGMGFISITIGWFVIQKIVKIEV